MTAARRIKRKPKRANVQALFQKLEGELNTVLREMQDEVRGTLVALLAREHVLQLGLPGAAKSMLARLVCSAVQGEFFDVLLSKFTEPNELLGPYSLTALKKDSHERITDGYLPEADVAFLDEIFKANSSILNALLRIINEREFRNGKQLVDVPLQTIIGASNELPDGENLEALHDRFLLRYWRGYIKDRSEFRSLLRDAADGDLGSVSTTMTMVQLSQAQGEAEAVDIGDDILDTLCEIKTAIEKDGFTVSDRRWVKLLKIVRANAYINGHSSVEEDDLLILSDCLWREPKDRSKLSAIVARVANPVAAEVQEILDSMKDLHGSIPIGERVPESEGAEIIAKVASVNAEYRKAIGRLKGLKNGKPSGRIDAAAEQIVAWSREAVAFAGKVSGLEL
jgi:MoxR-like ATPase